MSITKHTELYKSCGTVGGERNDCAVRALSLAANRPYSEVHAILAAFGRKPRRGTPYTALRSAALKLGLVELAVPGHGDYRAKYHQTLNQFVRQYPKGNYCIVRKGHAFAVIDGVVHDWARGTGPRSRVMWAYQAGGAA